MGVTKKVYKGCARFFYSIAAWFMTEINKTLKKNLDEFWESIEQYFDDDGDSESFVPQHQDMIEGVYDLRETKVREIMVPRTDLAAVRVSDSIDKAISLIQKEGRSRIPVFEDEIDNIVGVLYAKDILHKLASATNNHEVLIEKIMQPAHFVPETKNVFDLLQEMKANKRHLAIVIDEYGGTAGLVTMEDLIEEIIGEVQDEHDYEKERIVRVDACTWDVDAKLSIDDINEELDIAIKVNEDYDTLAGFILSKLGRIPAHKERIEDDNLLFIIVESDERSIEKVRIVKKDKTVCPEHTEEKGEVHDDKK